MGEATLEPLRSAVAPKSDRWQSGAKRGRVSLPHWSASAHLIAYARAALFAQVPEHIGRALKQPDCRWIVCFESSTPTRPPHTPAILIASRARCTCVRLTYLHPCTSAGPFLSHVRRVHVHGRHQEPGGACRTELMPRAAGAALSGLVQARRGVYGCARAAQTSWESCALSVRLRCAIVVTLLF